MAQSETPKKTSTESDNKRPNTDRQANSSKSNGKANAKSAQSRKNSQAASDLPKWLTPVMSMLSVGVAVGAGLYATRYKWMPAFDKAKDDFSAAFADDETDLENFDQTRHAGVDAMRDNPGEDWNDVDDMSDASFPASDPPSFTPGTAS